MFETCGAFDKWVHETDKTIEWAKLKCFALFCFLLTTYVQYFVHACDVRTYARAYVNVCSFVQLDCFLLIFGRIWQEQNKSHSH